MPGASLPGRAAPYTPPLTSARAWRCPPCLVLVPSVPLCPLHLGTSCRPSPLVLPHGACFLPAPPPRLPRARSQPSPIEGHQPPPGSPRPLPRLTPLAPADAPAPPRSARAQRVPGAGSPLLGQRLPAGMALPLAPDQQPAQESACPGGSGAGAGEPGWKEHPGLTTSLLEERHSLAPSARERRGCAAR